MTSRNGSILDLYQAYKISTDYALHWLWTHSNSGQKRTESSPASFQTTAEIVDAAKRLAAKAKEVPDGVLCALKNAIVARKKVLDLYRELTVTGDVEKDRDTVTSNSKHQAFVNR